jgi:hypothetical protein
MTPVSCRGDTDQKKPRLIGDADQFGAIDDKRHTGFRRNPAQTGGRGKSDRPWPDRRPVGAALLSGLCHFDEDAARPVAAQRGAASQ